MNDISKDKDYQEFLAGIKELVKGLMQIRERAAIVYAPIVEEFCARKHATANEAGRMLDYLFEFADDCLYALTCVPCDIIRMAPLSPLTACISVGQYRYQPTDMSGTI